MSVSFGVASAESHKGEDRQRLQSSVPRAPAASASSTATPASRLRRSAVHRVPAAAHRLARPPLPNAAIEDVFWAVDLEIGQRDLIDGTTATFWGQRRRRRAETRCARPRRRAARGARVRPALGVGVGRRLDGGGAGCGWRTACRSRRRETTIPTRPKSRANRMQAARDDPASAAADDVKCSRASSSAPRRSPSSVPTAPTAAAPFMNRSPTERPPVRGATEEHHAHPCYHDLQMTRRSAIGSRRIWLPDPELELDTVVVGASAAYIGSDGLWDVCSHQTAAKVAREARDASGAADALLAIAKRAYIKERPRARRDDRCRVDLNPGLVPFEPPAAGATCCALL